MVTTLSATGPTPRCCAAQVFLCVEPRPHYIPLLCRAAERSTTIARMRTLVIIVLNNGKQYVDAGLRVKRLKEPSSSAELVLVKLSAGLLCYGTPNIAKYPWRDYKGC